MRERGFSGTGLEALKEYMEDIDAEAECEGAVMFVDADVAEDKGDEASEAVAVLDEMVLILWFGDSGGVGGKVYGAVCGRGASLGQSKVEFRGGVGREKLVGRVTLEEGGR